MTILLSIAFPDYWVPDLKLSVTVVVCGHWLQDLTKPYLQSIFRNVTFPTAGWDLTDGLARDAGPDQALIFSNSRTAGQGSLKLGTTISIQNKTIHRPLLHIQP